MVIAINIKIPGNAEEGEKKTFITEVYSRIIQLQPLHTFVLITEAATQNFFSGYKNVILVPSPPLTANPAKWYIWFTLSLPAILKKYKVGILIHYGPVASLAAKVPQVMVIPHLGFNHQPSLYKRRELLFYSTFVSRSVKKVEKIFVFSMACQEDMERQYKAANNKTVVIYGGVDPNFGLINPERREQVKEKYTSGHEYFIYTGEIGLHKNLLNLLRAFSAFKKRQKSSMQLMIAGNERHVDAGFEESLRLFRFKDDVKLIRNPTAEETRDLTASAYGMIYPSEYECFATQPLQAMQSGVPVIASSKGPNTEILGEAALYANPLNFKEIAVKMMVLFRDEKLRKELIDKGLAQAGCYNWDRTSALLWDGIEKMMP